MNEIRIIGDQHMDDTAFIPIRGVHGQAAFAEAQRWMRGEWTPEERAEMERRQAEAAAKRQADWARDLASHEYLLRFATHPTLTLLLEAHAPHAYPADGPIRGYECHACPGDFNEDGDVAHPQWPCPTWKLIQSEGS